MTRLRGLWGFLSPYLFNLYTLRALAIVAAAIATPHLDPAFAAQVNRIVDELVGGDATAGMLAIAGGGYVLRDLIKKRRAFVPEASGAYWWLS